MANPYYSAYEAEIFDLAKNRTDKLFYNSSAEHASIVHKALAMYAQKEICIFSSSMCSEVSNNEEYCALIKKFLLKSENNKIRIILTDYNDNFCCQQIYQVLKYHPSQVCIKAYNGGVKYNDKEAHFTVVDDSAFRLETDIEKRMAFGNFNDQTKAVALKEVFDRIFNSENAKTVKVA